MIENRQTMLQIFPELFDKIKIKNVTNYPLSLLQSLKECCSINKDTKKIIAILTPGPHNSAYFEHAFLADEMGVELIEGNDLKILKTIDLKKYTPEIINIEVSKDNEKEIYNRYYYLYDNDELLNNVIDNVSEINVITHYSNFNNRFIILEKN